MKANGNACAGARLGSVLFALLAFVIAAAPVRANVRLPAIFSDHMVLQQGVKIPVWGGGDVGEEVTVTLGDRTGKATTGADGKWRVDLDTVPASTQPLTLVVAGHNSLKIQDVLVGEVWICSGQSNMEFNLKGAHNADTEIPKAADPQLRLFHVTRTTALDPQNDVPGKWELSAPETVGTFSAVGYFFGRDLREKYQRPVGMIESAWGGTPAQAWTSLSGLQKDPPFTAYIDAHAKVAADLPAATAAYPQLMADYHTQMTQWQSTDGAAYNAAVKAWDAAAMQATANNQPAPAHPKPDHPMPQPPPPPQGLPQTPTVLFNGMIAPLIPYAIKGVIWYQGEANASNGAEYATLFPRMITDWREKWGAGDFPFLFVQLPNWGAPQTKPVESGWAPLRDAQFKTLALPNTGMAVGIDLGDRNSAHPKDKADIARRLLLAAQHVAYGEELVYSGPTYDSMKVDGDKIRISFKNVGGGLKMGTPPWIAGGGTPPEPTALAGFAITGADKKWALAEARIEGEQVVVSSAQVPTPVAVRYGWAGNPPCNLYNKEGLPASPFRTDEWADATGASPPVPASTGAAAP